MSVHAPGRVALGGVTRAKRGLGRAVARALPSSAPMGGGRRSIVAGLSMTSMIDVLVVMTVFLLLTFSADGPCDARDLSSLPPAVNVTDMVDAPVIHVGADAILVDGTVATSRGEMSELTGHGRVQRLDGLFQVLKAKHDNARLAAPGREPPTHVVLSIGSDVPACVVKSVVMTASRSGYPSIDFMVQDARHEG